MDAKIYIVVVFLLSAAISLFGDGGANTNPPSECKAPDSKCGCGSSDGDSSGGDTGDSTEDECIKVHLGLGRTTPWTGGMKCSLKVFADDDAPEVFTPDSLYAVLGGYTFKRLGQRTLADGETPADVVFSHPNGEAVVFGFVRPK